MTLLILGATGRLGQELLREALLAGHQVRLVVRNQTKLPIQSPNLTVFEHPSLDEAVLQQSMSGCDVVLNTLNISRRSDFPWSPLRTPERFLSDTLQTVLRVAKTGQVRKLIVVTAWGVHETKADIPFWFRWLIDYSNIGVAYRDHERQENLLRASPLNWTIVRPVGLTNFRAIRPIRVTINGEPKPELTTSRANVARFMLTLLTDNRYSHNAVTISEH